MDASMHLNQGRTLLDKVLKFYPIMKEGDKSQVVLTDQDWMVLMDFTEHPDAKGLMPETVQQMSVDRTTRTIHVKTNDCDVEVKMG